MADDRRGLGKVEALALREALDDVDESDVGEAGLGESLGSGGGARGGAPAGAVVAPTLPAPMTVTLRRIVGLLVDWRAEGGFRWVASPCPWRH